MYFSTERVLGFRIGSEAGPCLRFTLSPDRGPVAGSSPRRASRTQPVAGGRPRRPSARRWPKAASRSPFPKQAARNVLFVPAASG